MTLPHLQPELVEAVVDEVLDHVGDVLVGLLAGHARNEHSAGEGLAPLDLLQKRLVVQHCRVHQNHQQQNHVVLKKN